MILNSLLEQSKEEEKKEMAKKHDENIKIVDKA
eukprot:CAMPEP_0176382336 /NCGR_PEP_ID=MMETSP0126-20121128/32613_1 /TAXON_ID=141414 ORGANISM="Strombidinopsis acuminatum, Strain SPMC142" /NCGR_SAMPLE_ID=MMETSP0126 /ASSEMBLY_ACC=CAM_ASM_000229 /LENGTH=32 /DNA_ID= /DNA_START= /DNA_END= /DNA_ORIENTATION=